MKNQIKPYLLSILSLAIVLGFFSIGFYNNWLQVKVVKPLMNIPKQVSQLDPEERRNFVYGESYTQSMKLAGFIASHYGSKAVLLFPPLGYLKSCDIDFHVPEPVVFYYFAGLQSKWITSSDADKSNLTLIYQNKGLRLVPINEKNSPLIMKTFSHFKTNL